MLLIKYIDRYNDNRYCYLLFIDKNSLYVEDETEFRDLLALEDPVFLIEKINSIKKYDSLKEKIEKQDELKQKKSIKRAKV